jgi:hypothetical protein
MAETEKASWYKTTYRWGQTNITEIDPSRYDIAWWREHWRKTRIQGTIINAGGIVNYYPTKFPLSHRAGYLGNRDLYGELVEAAREEGLVVLARMDSNRVYDEFYNAYPDWICRDIEGKPYKSGSLYMTCIFSEYYTEYLPAVMREIIERSKPDGFGDNGYSGLDRRHICYCSNCRKSFKEATGNQLPGKKDWSNPVYQEWILWNYRRRNEIWDLNNKNAKKYGGEHCLWIGMNSGEVLQQCIRFRDYKDICGKTDFFLLDCQSRKLESGFQHNADMGLLLQNLAGRDILVTESMAQYQHSAPVFRVASASQAEARMWMVSGMAGGIQPWWHHIGAYHEDRRQYTTAQPVFEFHEKNEKYLTRRKLIAPVGVLWSQTNIDFFGRDDAEVKTQLAWQGVVRAMTRHRIPYVPVHVDHLDREASKLRAVVLPGLGSLSDAQCDSIRRFVKNGGGLVACGETGLYDERGNLREDFGLADVFGVSHRGAHLGEEVPSRGSFEEASSHTYLRLIPELRKTVYGPKSGLEPDNASVGRHPVLDGFGETDILPFGGKLEVVSVNSSTFVPLYYIPAFPIYPPELSWIKDNQTSTPAAACSEHSGGGRVVYFAGDIDRCYGRDNLPDYGRLLANAISWTIKEELPLRLTGAGFIDCRLYAQPGRLVCHLVNLSNDGAWRGPVHEIVPTGPFELELRIPPASKNISVSLLVSAKQPPIETDGAWLKVSIPSIRDHEIVVAEGINGKA